MLASAPPLRPLRTHFGLAALLVLLSILLSTILAWRVPTPRQVAAPARPALDTLPLAFEPNAGQSDPAAHFLVHTAGGTLFFATHQVTLALASSAPDPANGAPGGATDSGAAPVLHHAASSAQTASARLVRLDFMGTDPGAQPAGAQRLPGRVNYFRGQNPANWHTDLPTYADLTYTNLYPGITLTYSGHAGQLKGTYTVAPGADPNRIRWRYEGAAGLRLDPAGNLQITVAGSPPLTVTEQAPAAWQDRAGQRVMIPSRYVLHEDGSIGFALGPYDPGQPLTIDPTLTYATYLGGFYQDEARSIALDGAGNIYVTGNTQSTDFPLVNPYQPVHGGQNDAFITKLSPDGATLIYSTFLGGNGEINGGEFGDFISVDAAGNVIVAGSTDSDDFPTTPGALQRTYAGTQDLFISKLNASGSALIFSTYYGDSGVEDPGGFATDAAGNTYFTGYYFPGFSSYAFVGKLSADGTQLLFRHDLGGQVPGPGDQNANSGGRGIAVDAANNVYVTGSTRAADFPVTAGAYRTTIQAFEDGFVTKLDPTGQTLIYSTYIPGGVSEYPDDITLDAAGNAYITGNTSSADFPTTPGAFDPTYGAGRDAFVTKLNAAGSALVYSTFLGGDVFGFTNVEDYGFAIRVDGTGSAYVVGYTESEDFPVVNAIQPTLHGPFDAFVTKFNPTGSALIYSTFLGGSAGDLADGIALDGGGTAYVVGWTDSSNFPVVTPVQPTNHGDTDGFIVKIAEQPPATATPGPSHTPVPGTPTPCGGPLAWRTEVPMTVARARSVGAVVSNQFYVIGGGANSPTPTPGLMERYDPATQSWAMLTPAPQGITYQGAATIGTRIYVMGSTYQPTQTFVQIYDTATGAWSQGAILPEALVNGALAAYNGTVYLFGGQIVNQPPSSHVYAYDPTTNSFTAKAPMPSGQAEIGAAALGNHIYVVGGYQYVHYAYDPALDTWTTIATPPTPTFSYLGVFVLNGELWVEGGYDNATRRGYPPGQEVQIYNPASNSWRFGPAFHLPRYYSTATGVIAGRAYVVGGIDLNSNNYPYTYLTEMESLSVPPCVSPTPGAPTTTPTRTPPAPTRTATIPAGASPSATLPTGISPTPPPTACLIQFSDVPPTNPFYPYIRCLACRGIVSGYSDGTFGWPNPVTRGQLSKILANAGGLTNVIPSTQQTFSDVAPTNAFWVFIERLAGTGAISGYACDGAGEPCDPLGRPYFRWMANATRGQISKITALTAGWNGPIPTTQQTFTDVTPSNAFWTWIEELASRGIISGYTCGGQGEPCDPQSRAYFRWTATATRGQMAKIAAETFFPNCHTPAQQ